MNLATDAELADRIREAIDRVAALMNEAKPRGIEVVFNIADVVVPASDPPTSLFVAMTIIKKAL